jgi:hypothetical protein
VTIPDHVLIALAERCERDVLALTVHVLRNPLRVQFLDAEGELVSFASDAAPRAQAIGVSGIESAEYGLLGG